MAQDRSAKALVRPHDRIPAPTGSDDRIHYVDIDDATKPVFILSGQTWFVSPNPLYTIDELTFNEDPDHNWIGDGQTGVHRAPRRPGDTYYDIDSDTLFEWVETP